jgi:hypothetical protein
MVWVRIATRSWRRLVNRCSTTAWSSTPTGRREGMLPAATATETASAGSLLRPCPTDRTRTRAASLAGTSTRARRRRPAAGPAPARCRGRPRPPSSAAASAQPTGATAGSRPGSRGHAVDRAAGHARRGRRRCGRPCGGSTPIITGMRTPFLSGGQENTGRTAQPFLSQPDGGSGVCGATCRHPGTYGLQPPGSYPRFNKSVAHR